MQDILSDENEVDDSLDKDDATADWLDDEFATQTESEEELQQQSVSYSDILEMFDFSTLRHHEDVDGNQEKVIKTKIVKVPKMIISANGDVSVVEERLLQYYERVEDTNTSGKARCRSVTAQSDGLNQDDSLTSMPSLTLNLARLRRGYNEPSRNREKDWVLDSHRQLLDAPILPAQTLVHF